MKNGECMTFRELRCKEVINCIDGVKLGYVADLEFCRENGQIEAFLVPEPGGCFGCFVNKVIRIPYCNVVRIGPDVIVVKHQPPPPPGRKKR